MNLSSASVIANTLRLRTSGTTIKSSCLVDISGSRNTDMAKYTLFTVLLLSILMPLQVAAEALLSASPCPMEMTMVDDTDSNEAMPCCPDDHDTSSTNTCKTAKTCHPCKTPCQVYLPATAFFTSLADLSLAPKPPLFHPTALNPASIWRPPSAS